MSFNINTSAQEFSSKVYALKPKKRNRALESTNAPDFSGIPKSDKLTGIELRLQNVLIKNNRTPRVFPFPGNASFYVIAVVLDNLTKEPVVLDLQGFGGIGDNTYLPIKRTLYYWNEKGKASNEYPQQIHAAVTIVKSKKGLRQTGSLLKRIKQDSEYKNIVSSIGPLLANPTAITVSAISNALAELSSLIGKAIEGVEDRPHYARMASFTDISGNFDTLGEHIYPDDHPNENASTDLVLYVRDKSRERKMLEVLTGTNTDMVEQIKENEKFSKRSYA